MAHTDAPRAPLAGLLAGLLLSQLGLSGCRSIQDDDWRFGLSRSFYAELADKMDDNEPVMDAESLGEDSMALLILPVAIALPLALDLAFLPGAAIHDAWVQ